LNQNCVGCHTGDNLDGGTTPYVYNTSVTYGTDTLAGGNFYWVATVGEGNDTKGHNVEGLSGIDGNLDQAPGNPVLTCTNNCHTSLAISVSYDDPSLGTLSGGCEGCHLQVAHHAPDHPGGDYSNGVGEDEGWFRYCSGHNSGLNAGVEGIEVEDWQLTPTSLSHNEYLGVESDFGAPASLQAGNTMSGYCCGCHGLFHIEQEAGVWIRHPSDAVLPSEGEYAQYTVYDPIAPVARPDLEAIGATETVVPGQDMVMCLSCHRAHGSPYPDMLRWDYDQQIAGGGGDDTEGCFICHTTKDGDVLP